MKKFIALIVFLSLAICHADTADKVLGNIKVDRLKWKSATELTIASGVVTATQTYHTVDGESDASDDLDTINGGSTGQQLYLVPANATRDITLKHGTGNIVTGSGSDYILPDNGIVFLQYDGSNWRLLSAGSGTVDTSGTPVANDYAKFTDANTIEGRSYSEMITDIGSSITTVGTIVSGTWNGTTIAIANGGTGQTTAQAAIDALLPTQAGNSGKYLTTDGTNASWGTPSGGTTADTDWTGTNWTQTAESPSFRVVEDALQGVAARYDDRASTFDAADTGKPLTAYYGGSGTYEFGNATLDASSADMIAYWAGENVNDYSGNSHTLTNVGTTTFTSAKNNNGFTLNGSNQQCNITSGFDSIDFTGDFSCFCWVYADDLTTYQGIINSSDGISYRVFIFYINQTTGTLTLSTRNSGGTVEVGLDSTSPISATTWTHVGFTKSGTTFTIYINGSAAGSVVDSYTPPSSDGVGVGSFYYNDNSTQLMNGKIDEVVMYDAAISGAQITALYNSGTGRFLSETSTGDYRLATSIAVDTIAESTADAGVTADSVLLKDGGIVCADAATLEVDTINEATAAAGVTIDSLAIKDAGFVLGSDADGDLYFRSSGALARLAKGTAYQALQMNSGATAPEWTSALIQQTLKAEHTAPTITLHNTTDEDGDGGRESQVIFKGDQSGGEETTLGLIEFSHDGTDDDEKGKWAIKVNDGDDGDAPSVTAIEGDSAGVLTMTSILTADSSNHMYLKSEFSSYVGIDENGNSTTDVFVVYKDGNTSNELLKVAENGTVTIPALTSTDPLATNASGDIIAGTSDRRLKTTIDAYDGGLDEVLKLKPVTYQWKKSSRMNDGGKSHVGFIAQDVEKVIPQAVGTRKQLGLADCRTFSDARLIPALVNAVKQLKEENNQLKKRIEKLEGK